MAKIWKLNTNAMGKGLQIYISSKIRYDSAYPFDERDESNLVIEIKKHGLLIRRKKEGEKV